MNSEALRQLKHIICTNICDFQCKLGVLNSANNLNSDSKHECCMTQIGYPGHADITQQQWLLLTHTHRREPKQTGEMEVL